MPTGQIDEQVSGMLASLLKKENRALLEQHRYPGSGNRVYMIPLEPDSDQFIVVKLLPNILADARGAIRCRIRNFMYGERDMAVWRERAEMEMQRTREWQEVGLPVAAPIETGLPRVRAFKGLPYRTLYTIFSDSDLTVDRKLGILEIFTGALSEQHQLAVRTERMGLVHKDPGPWNVMFDEEHDQVWWYDLEHPSHYPRMTMDDLLARVFRIYLHGNLVHFDDQMEDVVRVVLGNYRLTHVLWAYLEAMERRQRSLIYNTIERLRKNGSSHLLRRGITDVVRAELERTGASRSAPQPQVS